MNGDQLLLYSLNNVTKVATKTVTFEMYPKLGLEMEMEQKYFYWRHICRVFAIFLACD